MVCTVLSSSAALLAGHSVWLAGVWLVLAVLAASPELFTVSQIVVVIAILCGVTSIMETHDWYAATHHPWLDPWFLEAQGIALAAFCLVLSAIRWFVCGSSIIGVADSATSTVASWRSTAARYLNPPWPATDRVVSALLVVLLCMVAVYAAMPGAAQELSPTTTAHTRVVTSIEHFEMASIPHIHAADRGGWLLLFAVAAAIAGGLWERGRNGRWTALVVAAFASCLLVAARWDSQVAVASALRWVSALFFAFASVAIWFTRRSTAMPSAHESTGPPSLQPVVRALSAAPLSRILRDLLIAFVAAVNLALVVYVAEAALAQTTMDASVRHMWPWIGLWAVVAGLVGLVLPFAASEARRAEVVGSKSVESGARLASSLLLFLAVAPAAILAAFAVAKALTEFPLVGPEPTSWFARAGTEVSYGVPLFIIAVTLVGYAIRDRVSSFAFAAGLLFNTVATIVVLLQIAHHGGALDAVVWITVAEVNAIVAGVVALCWLAAVEWNRRHVAESLRDSQIHDQATARRVHSLLVTQVAPAAALCAMFLAPATVRLAIYNASWAALPAWVATAASPLGWSGIILAVAALNWLHRSRQTSQFAMAVLFATISSIIALTTLRFPVSDLAAYHMLLVGYCVAAWHVPAITAEFNRRNAGIVTERPISTWSAWPVRVFDVVVIWLALWEYSAVASWWVIGGLAAIAARNVVIAWREGRRSSVWIAAILVNLATTIWWLDIAHAGIGSLSHVARILAAVDQRPGSRGHRRRQRRRRASLDRCCDVGRIGSGHSPSNRAAHARVSPVRSMGHCRLPAVHHGHWPHGRLDGRFDRR